MKTTITIAVQNECSSDTIQSAVLRENQKYYHATVYLNKPLPLGVFLVPIDLWEFSDPTDKITRTVFTVWIVKDSFC